MSTYAARLSNYPNKGTVGSTELFDKDRTLKQKLAKLADFFRGAKDRGVVVFTGAGISTSAGIPDFRGPKGVWTLEKQGVIQPSTHDDGFATAQPTLTHRALVALHAAGFVKLVVSQNVDGLHLRSGLPAAALAELHGNMFLETCDRCGAKETVTAPSPTIGLVPTGGTCSSCGEAALRDTLLDWENELPEAELVAAEEGSDSADLVLCLGTSMQIQPANQLPQRCLKRRGERGPGKLVIVNLQRTPKDRLATLVVRARVDLVMESLCATLGVVIPGGCCGGGSDGRRGGSGYMCGSSADGGGGGGDGGGRGSNGGSGDGGDGGDDGGDGGSSRARKSARKS